MATPKDYYAGLHAQHYSWMFGAPFDEKVAEQIALLRAMGITAPGVSVDLGSGSGFQTVALANLGAERVYAIDTSAALLTELREQAGDLPITTCERDLLDFDAVLNGPADAIVCMGDTLTHLASRGEVAELFLRVAECLSEAGHFVISRRDLSAPPQGLDRFIPLRATDEKQMLCFLEDQGDTVMVHDLVHLRQPDGWTLHKSAYLKLKLPPEWVRDQIGVAGLNIVGTQIVRGMIVMAASR